METADRRQIGDKIADDGALTLEMGTADWRQIGDKLADDGALTLEMETADWSHWTMQGTADCHGTVEIAEI
jgi:hypothetical protein